MSNFSVEYWKHIGFGSKFDQYGGSRGPKASPEFTTFFAEEDTSRGHVEFSFIEGRFSVLASDLGIGLMYEKNGKLVTLGIDLIAYCMNLDKDDLGSADSVLLMDMLGQMIENNDRLFIGIDLLDKTLTLAKFNESTKKKEVVKYFEDIDYSKKNLARLNYNGNDLLLGLSNVDDEFIFGVRATDESIPDAKINTNMLVTTILSDCNYSTFLESSAEDKLEKLAKRIFM